MIAAVHDRNTFLVPGYALVLRNGRLSGACLACSVELIAARWCARTVALESNPHAARVLHRLREAAELNSDGDRFTIMYEYEFATGHVRREWIPPRATCSACKTAPTPRTIQLLGADIIDVFTAGAESRFFFKTVTGQRLAGKGVQASGAGGTKEIAELKAVGEYLERSASVFAAGSRYFGTYRALDLPSPHPQSYAIYSAEQYADPALGYAPFTENSEISWARGVNLATGDACYVPAQFCTFPYACDAPNEQYLSQWTTTGIAYGPTLEFATEGALLEVLERDALTISWLNRRSCRRIVGGPFEREHPPGWDIRYYDFTVDIRVPVVVAVTIHPESSAPLFTMGTGCAIDPADAFEKAHNEMLMCIEHAHLVRLYRQPVTRLEDIASFEDHSAYYAFGQPALLQPLSYLLEGNESVAYTAWIAEPWIDSVDILERTLQHAGYPPIAIELTPAWMAGTGNIVRAVVPAMQAIHADHARPYLGGERLSGVPAKVGFPAFDLRKGVIPHGLP